MQSSKREAAGEHGDDSDVNTVKADRNDCGETLPILRAMRWSTNGIREEKSGETLASISGLIPRAGGEPCSSEADGYGASRFQRKYFDQNVSG